MFKRIIKWTIYAGIVGLLIFGGVIRTQAKAGQEGTLSEYELKDLSSLYQDGRGNGAWPSDGEEDPIRGVGGAGRNDGSYGIGEELHLAEEEEHERFSLSGTVSGLDAGSLWIETDEGESLEITGRAWLFIQDADLGFEVDDAVELEGFFENEEFEVSVIRNLTSGDFLQIREESGRPLWSGGRGR